MTRPNFLIVRFIAHYDDRDAYVGGHWVVLDAAETLGWAERLRDRLNGKYGIERWEEDAAHVVTGEYGIPNVDKPNADRIYSEPDFDNCPF